MGFLRLRKLLIEQQDFLVAKVALKLAWGRYAHFKSLIIVFTLCGQLEEYHENGYYMSLSLVSYSYFW